MEDLDLEDEDLELEEIPLDTTKHDEVISCALLCYFICLAAYDRHLLP